MAEYIECEKYVKLNDIIETLEHEWGYEGMREDLYNLPTADVVEVVRCKDCKHSRICVDNGGVIMCILDSEKDEETDIDYGFLSFHSENHYCSYGKRKEGAEE